MKKIVIVLVIGASLLVGTERVRAEDAAGGEVSGEVLFRAGVELFAQDRFAEALDAFERSYALAQVNIVLYNIANCQRALDHLEAAIASFERYLANGGDRVPAERREAAVTAIVEMRAELETRQPQDAAPPEEGGDQGASPGNGPGEERGDPTEVGSGGEPPPPSDDDEVGLHRRWWFWVALLGGAAVAAGLGVGLGVGLTRNEPPPVADYPVNLP